MISSIATPRCIFDGIDADDKQAIQLHGFSDASKVVYGANVYIWVTSANAILTSLLVSKTRVAPLKGETISKPFDSCVRSIELRFKD